MKIKESQLRIASADVYDALCTALHKAGRERARHVYAHLMAMSPDEWDEVYQWMIRELRIPK